MRHPHKLRNRAGTNSFPCVWGCIALAARLLDLTKPPELDRYNPNLLLYAGFVVMAGGSELLTREKQKSLQTGF
jgi:hypothetical protein